MKPITFISAKDGYIQFHNSDHEVARAKCPLGIAHVIVAYDVDLLGLYASSSMDFAKEYGFEDNSSAWKLFNQGVAESLIDA